MLIKFMSVSCDLAAMSLTRTMQMHRDTVGFDPSTLVIPHHMLEYALKVRDAEGLEHLRIQVLWGIPSDVWFVASPECVVFGMAK